MRILLISKTTDLTALITRLLGDKAGAGSGIDALKRLNPHVDFDRLGAGTVLLVPDLPGLREGETTSIGGEAFGAFGEQVHTGLDEVAAQVRSAHAARLADQKDLGALLKSAPLRRAFDADAQLKAQADAAGLVFKQDAVDAKAADEALKALQDLAGTELAALGKLLG